MERISNLGDKLLDKASDLGFFYFFVVYLSISFFVITLLFIVCAVVLWVLSLIGLWPLWFILVPVIYAWYKVLTE